MDEDASLDDFLGGESSEQSEAGDVGSADEESAGEPEPADETELAGDTQSSATVGTETAAADDDPVDTDIEPAATTYAWSDEGTTCDGCGETVERRWQQAGDLVCIDCKDWERA